ncbi:MAG: hypothetical protein IJ751_02040, partial [Oscillospiraceae bacterium]|nr:hypothetical protein [Oscillospiraceae bacterium]
MRRRVIAVLLCCALLTGLTGCGSFYTRSYSSILPHQEQSASDEDASILRAENYTDLVSCVQHFVSMGQSSGTIHLYQYTGDVEKDLEAACDEVLTQDPLGAYMLSRIDHSYSHIVSYYECTLSFTYRRTMQDMAAIVSAYGTGTIRDQIGAALSSFQPGLVLRTSEYYA